MPDLELTLPESSRHLASVSLQQLKLGRGGMYTTARGRYLGESSLTLDANSGLNGCRAVHRPGQYGKHQNFRYALTGTA